MTRQEMREFAQGQVAWYQKMIQWDKEQLERISEQLKRTRKEDKEMKEFAQTYMEGRLAYMYKGNYQGEETKKLLNDRRRYQREIKKYTVRVEQYKNDVIKYSDAPQEAQEAPQSAPTAEAEQQPTETDAVTLAPAEAASVWTEDGETVEPTETENAPQAATQAAQDAATEPAPVGVWLDNGSATDSQTAREMIRANLEYLEPDDPARAEQLELLAELDRQEGRQQAQEGHQEPAQRVYNVYFTDHPNQAMAVKARTKREAEKAGRLYIRQWQLDATIDRIERA